MTWFEQLGPTGYPLLFCSVAMVGMAVERLLFYLSQGSACGTLAAQLSPLLLNSKWAEAERLLEKGHCLLARGATLLIDHRQNTKTLRDEIVCHWLTAQQRRLFAHLKWLTLIAVVSPMLGLLGTVFGIIESFQSIAQNSGPVSPALLAGGLWQAMYTTAAGLTIALPALVTVHGFRIWGEARLDRLSAALNRLDFALEGVALERRPVNYCTEPAADGVQA